MSRELLIEALGALGDGVASEPDGPVHVPYALPGERVRAEISGDRGRVVDILEASDDRVAPVCPHFGVCGGCALQHVAAPAYLAWKRDRVARAFAARGIETEVAPVVPVTDPASRRRAVFAARRLRGGVLLGFRERRSRTIVDVGDCAVLRPAIGRALPGLRKLLALLLTRRGEASVSVLESATGLDVSVEGAREIASAQSLADIAALADRHDLARLTLDGEVLVERRQPVLWLGGCEVTVPPGGFVQAVAAAEDALIDQVLAAVPGPACVADLFAGIGTFTLPLAEVAEVTAVEHDAAALAALDGAVRRASGLKPVRLLRRDLFREPLAADELVPFDAVAFDPPRAGARAQAEALARSGVARVIAVSCNPATLARDARILIDGGYALESVQPVDQFVFSHHVEVVAAFGR